MGQLQAGGGKPLLCALVVEEVVTHLISILPPGNREASTYPERLPTLSAIQTIWLII